MVYQSDDGSGPDEHDLWYVRGPEGESGPLHRFELVARIRSGDIPPHAMVRRGATQQHWLARAFAAAEALSHLHDELPDGAAPAAAGDG